MISEKNNISNKYIDMNITNILKNKINKQINKYVTDKKTISAFSKHVQSLGDDKKLLKTSNSQLSNLQKYNINNISGGKLLKQVKNHTFGIQYFKLHYMYFVFWKGF